ncbi:MAG: 5-(carboxyamino)imidazole ribonucleotide synthase [Bacteroidetes bacterium]|nr:5-(carboxyamino)imidazole ribonucleotide synthase [Bacteroidota bacterium]
MTKVGILGGGQLGRMLLESAAKFKAETYVLENQENCPAYPFCDHFTLGDIRDYDTVYSFGKGLDCITIEIEQVCVEALEKLEEEGITVIPKPSVLKMISNKISQKEFYQQHSIPTPDFFITYSREELVKLIDFFPAVHKVGLGGYDGKGVELLYDINDIHKGFDAPAVLEKMTEIKHEIAVQVAVDQAKNIAVFPPVEMVFDPRLNLLDFQICPARLSPSLQKEAIEIATNLVNAFQSPGLFAVELFVDQSAKIWVNETAPRVHNSGHHSIEAIATSQFEMLWQILLKEPLGPTHVKKSSIMVNIIGAPNYSGIAKLEGADSITDQDTFIHWYGKETTKPGRKMGHVTRLNIKPENANETAHFLKNSIRCLSDTKENKDSLV